MSIAGVVQNGVVILDGVAIPDGTHVEVFVKEETSEVVHAGLLKLAGIVDDLPEDMSVNHDHYLHGAPKK